ncbi:phosphotransferase family protein [Streptomyces profundus]|uniref:phosphotransferase family protein n=1 Tax=Streptomyces profundus TaxID=2867410 RepID=UPI001D15F15C|nr:aminoglycoside phosphotransferase family protein [Streptomyces sp. MA3_2.13]
MTYERGLLRGEAEFYRIAREYHAAPVPEVVFFDEADPSGMLMTERPGRPWNEAATDLDAPATARLRHQLGSCVARLHQITGTRFGYPGGAIPMADSWREAFTAMLAALLHDAERYRAPLPLPLDRVHALTEAAAPALEMVTTPALVHFDLWQGNVLLHNGEISALIDGDGGTSRKESGGGRSGATRWPSWSPSTCWPTPSATPTSSPAIRPQA